MPRAQTGVVYWLYNERCICPWRHGYIGVTTNWPQRVYRHRRESDFPPNYQTRILFVGPLKHCLVLETKFRPTANIGWNRLPGGLLGHAMKGIPKPPEQREKMRQAALRRFADQTERERMSKAVKKGLKHIDRTGANNPNFGKQTSEEAKQKMRDRIAERGGISGENNPNYRHGGYQKQ